MWQDKRITPVGALLWVTCLAFLAVGARNFELGLSSDAPLYASIARHMVRSHEWFAMYGGIPDFVPYTEHPHLGFWVFAAVFRVLPFADWAARVPGHLYYIAFLLVYFLYVRRVSDEKIATWSVLLLWTWYRFSNFFSTVYLDPGALFFGACGVMLWEIALRERRGSAAPLAGLCLGLCALYKGLTVLGFLPACAVLVAVERPTGDRLRDLARDAAWLIGAALLPCVIYVIALHESRVPNFLALYWQRQMSLRFAQSWSWGGLVRAKFWGQLFRDSYFLMPAALAAFAPGRSRRHLWLPASLFVTFVFMYAPAERVGNQYQLMFLPWLSWLIAEGVLRFIPWRPVALVRATAWIAVIAVCLLQYIPIRTHGVEPPSEAPEILRLKKEQGIKLALLDMSPNHIGFISSAPYVWYGDIDVDYGDIAPEIIRADVSKVYILVKGSPERRERLQRAGWCLHQTYPLSTLWLACLHVERDSRQGHGRENPRPIEVRERR